MFGSNISIGRKRSDDGEKPFWISFSDLMSALMVLFLVVMTVALLSVTQALRDAQKQASERHKDISQIMARLSDKAHAFPQVSVSEERMTIDFSEVGRFAHSSDVLSPQAIDLLRAFVPKVLEEARTDLGKKWFKRVIVEGFTDSDGSYLFNLDLSLRRAERVVCSLLTTGAVSAPNLSDSDMSQVRLLFMVGGFSFNSAKVSKDESRRVELQLDFRALGEGDAARLGSANLATIDVGKCQLR